MENALYNQRLIVKGMCVTVDVVKISTFTKGVSSVSALQNHRNRKAITQIGINIGVKIDCNVVKMFW